MSNIEPTEATRAVARYVAAPPARPLQEDAAVFSVALMDWVAVTIEGSTEQSAHLARTLMASQGGRGRCSLLGFAETGTALSAALVNGVSSHSQDFDDIHDFMSLHLETPVFCAALAAAQHADVSGRRFAEGVLKGMQVMAALGDCILPEHFAVGWHATATIGVFGAAAACGSILGLSEQELCWALGLAASCSAGLQFNMGSMAKAYQAAHAARQGLEAALLAQSGFTANERILDVAYLELLSAKIDRAALQARLSAPSALYELRYKLFPCGIPTHPGILNCAAIAREQGLTLQDIEKIIYTTFPRGKKLTGNPAPQSPLEGKFSIAFCGAAAFVNGTVDNSTFTEEMIRDPRLLRLLQLSEVKTDEAFNHTRGGRTEIICTDGRSFTREAHLVGKAVRLADQIGQVEQKYDGIMARRYGHERAEQIKGAIRTMLELPTIFALTDQLQGCGPTA